MTKPTSSPNVIASIAGGMKVIMLCALERWGWFRVLLGHTSTRNRGSHLCVCLNVFQFVVIH